MYGTCIYRRFSPRILASISEPGTACFKERLKSIINDSKAIWDFEIQKQNAIMPIGWELVMCDVDCGSSTVSMVKRVLEWRKDNSMMASVIWEKLQQLQEILLAQLKACDAPGVRKSLEGIRQQVRIMSDMSGVPVEPAEQTALLDAVILNVRGVIGGVIPGAGGYDAVVFLVRDYEATIKDLAAFLQEWIADKGGKIKLLRSKSVPDGVKLENYENYTANL